MGVDVGSSIDCCIMFWSRCEEESRLGVSNTVSGCPPLRCACEFACAILRSRCFFLAAAVEDCFRFARGGSLSELDGREVLEFERGA